MEFKQLTVAEMMNTKLRCQAEINTESLDKNLTRFSKKLKRKMNHLNRKKKLVRNVLERNRKGEREKEEGGKS